MKRFSAGEKFPELTLPLYNAPAMPVSGILKGITVFWILRYIGCPFCQYDMVMLKHSYDRFKELGAQVFVVLQSDAEHIRGSVEEGNFPFGIVCDVKQEVYKTLSVEPASDEAGCLGDHGLFMKKVALVDSMGYSHGDYEGNELQLPALFVVDENQAILYAHYAKDALDMPSPDELLQLLKELAGR